MRSILTEPSPKQNFSAFNHQGTRDNLTSCYENNARFIKICELTNPQVLHKDFSLLSGIQTFSSRKKKSHVRGLDVFHLTNMVDKIAMCTAGTREKAKKALSCPIVKNSWHLPSCACMYTSVYLAIYKHKY